MPTYEYECKDCGNGLEVVQAFTDDALTTCPSCGGSLKKKFGSVGISFKGSGFYKNDSRGGSSSTSTSTASGTATSTPSTSDTSSGSSDSSSSTTSDSGSSSASDSSSASGSSSAPSTPAST
jgi:putative FmdB family regulatory protein